MDYREEHDTMGTVAVPATAYYGAQTARAMANFPIGFATMSPAFIHALCLLKQAAAEANLELGKLSADTAKAIIQAAAEAAKGKFDTDFPISVYQTGSGTSSNMNANEVIACRANEILTGTRAVHGEIHPNDDVNKGQSSNDIIPTAIHLAVMLELKNQLLPSLGHLEASLRRKSEELWPVIKTGRTHLQDATPIRLGQEFLGFADQLQLASDRLRASLTALGAVALGGTAVGTGINSHPRFAGLVLSRIAELTELPIHETPHHFVAQSSIDELVATSGALRTLAVALIKICNDIRWMSSGPRAGLGEITLPELQPGSSIMPGKVNPVIAESAIMAAAQVIGYDATISLCGQAGNFELNVTLPVVAHDLLDGIAILAASTRNLAERMVEAIDATDRGPDMVEAGLMLTTALAPEIGYDAAAAIAKEAYQSGETVREVARRLGALPDERLEDLLNPERMLEPSG
jgi:fumarate hydratase class II